MGYCDTVLGMSDEDIRELPPAVWDDLKKQVTDETAEARTADERSKGQQALQKLERRVGGNPEADL